MRHNAIIVETLLSIMELPCQRVWWKICKMMHKQLDRGGRALLEHPWPSELWRMPEVKTLVRRMQKLKAEEQRLLDHDEPSQAHRENLRQAQPQPRNQP